VVPAPNDPLALNAQLQRHHQAVHALAIMDHEHLATAIATTVRELAAALEVARVSVWTYDKDRTEIRCRGLQHHGVFSTGAVVVRGATHPRYFAALREYRVVDASDARLDTRTSEFRDDYLKPLGITSMLDVSLLVGGESIGVLCAEHIGAPREWTEPEAALMTSAAALLAIGFAIDRQRSLEEQLRQSQKMEAVGLLAGGIAHDVNNVLNIVVGEAELLEDALPTAESLARVVSIRDAARRGAGLTHKLLTFSRQRPVVLEPLDLSAVVAGAEHLMRGAVSESVRIHVRRPADPTMVLADATLVEQLLLNLVVNAGHAMPQGGELSITVDVAPAGSASADVTAEQGGALARLRVSDTGVGMSQELLQRIWEPFFTTRELGSGLGLAIVHGAVRQMRGSVTVESEPGHGSSFSIHLPLLGAVPAAAQAAPAARTPAATHLLLAEDEPDVRRVIAATLRRAGYEVTEAEDGEAAVALFAQRPSEFDLFVSDVMMPRLDGPGAFQRMQALRPGINALFLSGYAPESHRLAGLARDGSRAEQLAKPVARRDLLAAVAGLLAAPPIAAAR
jgi:signal transduction histidine kinase/CheY-like chemotaxis protein